MSKHKQDISAISSTDMPLTISTAVVVSDSDPLSVLDEIEHRLATIPRIEEAIEIMDQADALRSLARHAVKGLLAQNRCAYIKFLAQRRAGELLEKIERSNPGESKAGKKDIGIRATLDRIEIAPSTAKRWQQLATVPVDLITKAWKTADKWGEELTETRVHSIVWDLKSGGRAAEQQCADETDGDFYTRVWKGMPAFSRNSKMPFQKIVVNFETREDVEKFAALVDQRLTDKTDSIWFPYKKRNDIKNGPAFVDVNSPRRKSLSTLT